MNLGTAMYTAMNRALYTIGDAESIGIYVGRLQRYQVSQTVTVQPAVDPLKHLFTPNLLKVTENSQMSMEPSTCCLAGAIQAEPHAMLPRSSCNKWSLPSQIKPIHSLLDFNSTHVVWSVFQAPSRPSFAPSALN